MGSLSAVQIAEFKQNGFLVVEDVLSREEVAAIAARVVVDGALGGHGAREARPPPLVVEQRRVVLSPRHPWGAQLGDSGRRGHA